MSEQKKTLEQRIVGAFRLHGLNCDCDDGRSCYWCKVIVSVEEAVTEAQERLAQENEKKDRTITAIDRRLELGIERCDKAEADLSSLRARVQEIEAEKKNLRIQNAGLRGLNSELLSKLPTRQPLSDDTRDEIDATT